MEEGLDRFDSALTKNMHEFNVQVAQSDELDDLTRPIDKANRQLAMKFKREHKYDLQIYDEQLYKEVIYDTRKNATEVESYRYTNPLKKARKGGGQIRNMHKHMEELEDLMIAPMHQRKQTPYSHLHREMNPIKNKMYDPYAYLHKNYSKEEEESFV